MARLPEALDLDIFCPSPVHGACEPTLCYLIQQRGKATPLSTERFEHSQAFDQLHPAAFSNHSPRGLTFMLSSLTIGLHETAVMVKKLHFE